MSRISYLKETSNYIQLSTGDEIRISPLDNHIVRIYFVDANGDETHIPKGYNMQDERGDIVAILKNNFLVTWSVNYILQYQGQAVLRLNQKRHHVIYAPEHIKMGCVQRDFQSSIVLDRASL